MKKILLLLFILINFSFASIGQITALVGDIKISRDSKTILAKLGEKLEKNDVINSSKGSKAQITMNDNTIITIGQNSTLNIFDYVYDESKPKDSKASFGFMKGSFKSITGKIGKLNKNRFKLRTKSASIGIRGTTIIGNQQIIICTDGAISVTANNFTVNVDKQEFTRLPQGKAPTPPEPLKQDTLEKLEQLADTSNTTTPPKLNVKFTVLWSDISYSVFPSNMSPCITLPVNVLLVVSPPIKSSIILPAVFVPAIHPPV